MNHIMSQLEYQYDCPTGDMHQNIQQPTDHSDVNVEEEINLVVSTFISQTLMRSLSVNLPLLHVQR